MSVDFPRLIVLALVPLAGIVAAIYLAVVLRRRR
jgi:hypothetical protein